MRFAFFLALSTLLTVTACDDGDTTPVETPPADPYACDGNADFTLYQPLVSPAFDPAQGGLLIPGGDSYVVHTTQLVNDPTQMELFLQLMGGISEQLAQTEGLIAVSLGGSEACGYSRTLAIWADEASMYKFVGSGAHAEAMGQTLVVSSSGRVTHWTATADEVNALTWDVAKSRIAEVETSPLYQR